MACEQARPWKVKAGGDWEAAAHPNTSQGDLMGGSLLDPQGDSQDTQNEAGRGNSALAAPSQTSVYVGWSQAPLAGLPFAG